MTDAQFLKIMETFEEWRQYKFQWGEHDCLQFVSTALSRAGACDDYAAKARGTYTTPLGAVRAIRKVYGKGGADGILDELFLRVPISQAPRGSIVEIGDQPFPTFGIHVGAGIITMTEGGADCLPIGMGVRAWAVR